MRRFVLLAKFRKLPAPLLVCMARDRGEAAIVFTHRLNSVSRLQWKPDVIAGFIKEDNGQLRLEVNQYV